MWWYGYGWWWWWIAFLLIFFLLPLSYGWGYRGWGPWYSRRQPPTRGGRISRDVPPGSQVPPEDEELTGWGWIAAFLWFVLVLAVIWAIAAFFWGWGTW